MRIAVMQPYLFPFIGYFQMINSVDKFIFYDDVNFIKQGWINRNAILLNNKAHVFTTPIDSANSFVEIKETRINKKLYEGWKSKFLQTVFQNYKKAPYFEQTYPLIVKVLDSETDTISDLAISSVLEVSKYLNIKTKFEISSKKYNNKNLNRQNRLIDICNQENAGYYINAIGGQALYEKKDFAIHNIQLNFILSKPIDYKQFSGEFVPWLSIIDVLMFNSPEEVNEMLNQYELI